MRTIDADELTGKILTTTFTEKNMWALNLLLGLIEDIPTVGGWISVKDGLPEEKENQYTEDYQEVICVLKTCFGSDVRVYKFGKGHFWNGPNEIDRYITHWMYFPKPPKENEDGTK